MTRAFSKETPKARWTIDLWHESFRAFALVGHGLLCNRRVMSRAFFFAATKNLLLASFATLSLAACGDSSSSTSTGGGGSGGSSGECPDNLTVAKNSEFCESTPGDLDCTLVTGSFKHQLCGVALPDPPKELTRSAGVLEFSGSGPPDVSCFQSGNYPDKPGTPQDVTIKGFARIFSSGCNSKELKITVHRVQPDGQLGEPVGSSVVTAADCTDIGEASEADNCDTRWECPFEYPGVPSETELAIRTENPSGVMRWSPLVQYNIYVPNSEIVDGSWTTDVRALAEDDFTVIPQTAIGSPITSGNGAVAGEVHDCGDVRLLDAVVDIDKQKKLLTYFSSSEANPVPDTSARGTSPLGLYAALDVAEGPVTVAAGGLVNGEFVSLGQHRVWVYPNTVTSVTFKGLRPYQVP